MVGGASLGDVALCSFATSKLPAKHERTSSPCDPSPVYCTYESGNFCARFPEQQSRRCGPSKPTDNVPEDHPPCTTKHGAGENKLSHVFAAFSRLAYLKSRLGSRSKQFLQTSPGK